jgi:hypothetical protein
MVEETPQELIQGILPHHAHKANERNHLLMPPGISGGFKMEYSSVLELEPFLS